MNTRAKFKCVEKTETEPSGGGKSFKVKLAPVTCGSPENESFYRWTPFGSIELGLLSADVAAGFEPGKQYYVDFSEAP